MKSGKYLFCALVVFLLLGAFPAYGIPYWVQDGVQPSPLLRYDWLAVSTVNDSTAWAVGDTGIYAMRRFDPVYKGNWIKEDLPDYDSSGIENYRLNDVFVLPSDPGCIWIVGEKRLPGSPDNHKGVVIYTTNGGTNWWSKFPLKDDPDFPLTPFYAVCFANQDDGYIAAGNGIVLWTDNGGDIWYKTGSTPGSRSDCFVDIWTEPGDASEVRVVSDNYAVIAKSTDGGANWTKDETSDFDRTYSIPDLGGPYAGKLANSDVSFSSSDTGAIALSHGRVARTTDGGDNWSVDTLEPDPIWFEACDYGSGDTLFLVSGDGLIRADLGGIESHNWLFDFHDISMADTLGFAVGDYVNDTLGRKYHRYDPTTVTLDSLVIWCEDNGAPVWFYWTASVERNTKAWYLSRGASPFVPLVKYGYHMASARGYASTDTSYVRLWGWPDPWNTTYYLFLSVRDSNEAEFYCAGPWEMKIDCPDWGESHDTMNAPQNLSVVDVAGDEGGVIQLSWSPPDGQTPPEYHIGRSTSLDEPYWTIAEVTGTTFLDTTALTGKKYYYSVISLSSSDRWAHSASEPDNAVDSATAIDNTPPDTVNSLWIAWQRRYAGGDSILVCIEWTEDAEDSTIAGYWVCPIEPQQTLRGIAGLAPIQRNWYVFAADWKTGDMVSVGVLAMDYSDSMGTGWLDLDVYIAAHHTRLYDATADNNGNRIAQTTNGDLHIGFASQERDTDFVYYQTSTDDGKRWTWPTEVGRGRDPCLGVNAGGWPYMIWRKTELSGGDLVGKLYFSKKDQQGWSTPCELYSTTARNFAVGPPAVATDDTGTANIVWKAREPLSGEFYADIVFVGYLGTSPSSPEFSYEPIDTVWSGILEEDLHDPIAASASIDLDLGGLPHIVWEKSGEIYYAAKTAPGWPEAHEIISVSPSLDSRKPHIDLQGSWIRVVWEEENSSSGYYDVAVWSHWKGADMETSEISTLSSNCLDPVVDGDFILWSEKVGDHYEVFVSRYDWENYEWGDSLNISGYSHADSRYPQVLAPPLRCGQKPRIYSYWTEGPNPYWTRFQMREFEDPDDQAYYALDLGLETPSPITVDRDGYSTYGASPYQTVDYDTDTLRYQCNLDSTYTYTLELTYYHEGGPTRSYELLIDGTPVDTSAVPSEQKVTVDETVPAAALLDGQITVELRETNGGTATCGEFLLFQCVQGGGEGGGQAAMRRTYLPTRPMLKAPYPNPSADQPVFQYFLPQRSQAVLRVFDVTGRLVETIVNDTQKPGWHKAAWNGANQASGIYFCRFNAGETCMTQKFILLH